MYLFSSSFVELLSRFFLLHLYRESQLLIARRGDLGLSFLGLKRSVRIVTSSDGDFEKHTFIIHLD